MVANPYDDFRSMAHPAHWGTNFTKTIHQKPSPAIDPAKVTLPDGYTVVITGAGKGIGEYIAKAYAEAKAENFVLTSRTKTDLERVKAELEKIAAGQNRKINVSISAGDASNPESYKVVGDILKNSYGGRLDCLVNNAGGGDLSDIGRTLHERELGIFTDITTLNYLGPFYGSMILMPYLLDGKTSGKTLINIVSGAAHMIDMGPPSYNVAKFAATRLTEVIDASYSKQGLVAFAVHPGAVQTPGALAQLPDAKDFLVDDIHLCGAVCVWLSKQEPAWASGRYISANWDMDEFKALEHEVVSGDKLKFRMVV